jgi:hypothetical protein
MGAPSIPDTFTFTLAGGVDVGLEAIKVLQIPTITVDAGLDKIRVKELPKISVGLDDIRVKELPKINVGLDDIRVRELPKIELELSLKPTRVHVPAHYEMCFSLLGTELFKVGVCGETMVITEPYVPHETEGCA